MNQGITSILLSLGGVFAILGIAFALSSARRKINLRVVGSAFALQAITALVVLRTEAGVAVIGGLSRGVIALLDFSKVGITSVFGPMENNPFANTFVIGALPVIVFFAAIVSILYHLGIMQRLVRWVGGAIGWITGISKVEALGAAANIFVGQSESPLVVRPYLAALSPSGLFTLMAVGMAGVAGTILAAYASFIGEEAVPFLLAAAFMSAPGGILMAKIMMPDDGVAALGADIGAAAVAKARGKSNTLTEATRVVMYDENGQEVELPQARISAVGPASIVEPGQKADEVTSAETFEEGQRPANIIEAAAQGTQTGVKLAVAVGAMVMVFVALVALANGMLAGIGGGIVNLAAQTGSPLSPDVAAWLSTISFQKLLGYIFAPVMFLIGISDWDQAQIAGGLFGTKIVLNEFVAFIDLGAMQAGELTARSRAIITFALCGFANFSSIAIQMAVTGGLAPNQRPVIAKLGLKALAAGSLANLMSAALASLFLPY
ncbi:NupC/NupG family nucleoside CNT transporter [Porphyrobacter sp. LM 6]|uniref:NupC/NupG family nucleoside CNT transporter n=1 Tax=Porphyrobacter sp. LM 6 TaxID=1896196 RepID=UPI0008638CE3|nr:nucleoside transporter C-terminal domain-containing protein [Porphyrobacter sp. LM 6]AOL93684.1 concentrative nucleoside transporter, CNT family [Porphyrobacter sp. LM 6]